MKDPITLSMIVYFFCGLASGFSCGFDYAFTIAFTHKLCFFAGAVYASACGVKDYKYLLWSFFAYLSTGLLVSVYSFLDGLAKGFQEPSGNWASMHKNQIGDTASTVFLIALNILLANRKMPIKVVSVFVMAVAAAGLLATLSRGAVLATAAATMLVLLLRKTKPVILISVFAVVAIGFCGIVALAPTTTVSSVTATDEGSSYAARPYFWEIIKNHVTAHPFSALGWGQYIKEVDTNREVDNYCNFLLADYVQGGPLSALAIIAVLATTFIYGVKNALVAKAGPLKIINLMALSIVVSRFLHGSVEAFWELVMDNFIAFSSIGIIMYVRQQLKPGVKEVE